MANTSEVLKKWGLWLEAWVVPPVCVHCAKRRWGGLPLCRPCLRLLRAALIWDDEVLSQPGLHALFRMSPPLLSLIHGFKYSHYRRHIRFLCAYLRYRPAFVEALGKPDVLIPVPLHSARLRERGYNQAELIAEEMGRRYVLPVMSNALKRIRFTSTQTKLDAEERTRNLVGAFRCSDAVAGKKVVLVDDVCTTGSTLGQCQQELIKAGAARVDAFVLGWVEREDSINRR